MGQRDNDKAKELGEFEAYRMCRRKNKYKSSEANYYANKYNQRKYHCPICDQWHLSKKGVK